MVVKYILQEKIQIYIASQCNYTDKYMSLLLFNIAVTNLF